MRTVKIYGVLNPITDQMLYIGASMTPEIRFQSHKYGFEWHPITYRYKQVKLLKELKVPPVLVILEEVFSGSVSERELYWIGFYKGKGHRIDQVYSGYPEKFNPTGIPTLDRQDWPIKKETK